MTVNASLKYYLFFAKQLHCSIDREKSGNHFQILFPINPRSLIFCSTKTREDNCPTYVDEFRIVVFFLVCLSPKPFDALDMRFRFQMQKIIKMIYIHVRENFGNV